MLEQIRQFFAQRSVLEVETPLLSRAGVTEPQIHNLTTQAAPPTLQDSTTLYLQTSPEYAMKRLLAAMSEPIYQVGRAFRDEELGRVHNPEFTLLEWYRPGFDYHQLMDEVAELVMTLGTWTDAARISYGQAFREILAIDPHASSESALRDFVQQRELVVNAQRLTWDGLLDLILSQCIAPVCRDSYSSTTTPQARPL